MENIFNKIKITKGLHLAIYNYLSPTHKYILRVENSAYYRNILIKYDADLMCCYIKNFISRSNDIIIGFSKYVNLKNMI